MALTRFTIGKQYNVLARTQANLKKKIEGEEIDYIKSKGDG